MSSSTSPMIAATVKPQHKQGPEPPGRDADSSSLGKSAKREQSKQQTNTQQCPQALFRKLEETKLCITDVYEEVGKFKVKMLQQKEDSFFGYHTKQLMNKQVLPQRSKQQKDFLKLYDSVIAYIDKWFDFSSENMMMKLKLISLHEELSFTDLEQVAVFLKMTETESMNQL
ncbi:hypothetical protein DPX16_3800 [Anabarilius grahami]|uniref:Uncharacterized protein n=1 Tax=Anabarilius grahami TaxID=495550 RepID=A0A3N0XHK2_ANAGA|nr:hypothetical protein DPX16_3800 [Anabarilius grahami]